MENNTVTENLKALKQQLPRNYTRANAKKLQTSFLEYQRTTAALPEGPAIPQDHENHLARLKPAIDAVFYPSESLKVSRQAFRAALQQLHEAIDNWLTA